MLYVKISRGMSSWEEDCMKNLMIAVLVAAFAFMVSAQEKKAPREHSMTGCLQKGSEPDSYMLTNVEGNGPKTIGGRCHPVLLARTGRADTERSKGRIWTGPALRLSCARNNR